METLVQMVIILLAVLSLLTSVRIVLSLRNDRSSYKELYLQVSSENVRLQAENQKLKILLDEEGR